jgi:hypothetical protein
MHQLWKIGQQLVIKPTTIRNLFLAGSSCATFSFLSTPTKQFLNNMNAITPTKVNITLGIGLMLLVSNAYFAYLYYQSSETGKSEQPDEQHTPAP